MDAQPPPPLPSPPRQQQQQPNRQGQRNPPSSDSDAMTFLTLVIVFISFAVYFSMVKSNEAVKSKNERSYVHWTTQMDTVLTNVLLEHHSLGHKTPNGWKSTTFTAAITSLKDVCTVDLNKEKITARLKTWNKYYQDVSLMLDTNGFGWDWEQNIVKVDSEEVWANYVKAHPSVKHYRGKVIVNWADLGVICGNDKATGSHAATAVENIIELDGESVAEASNIEGERLRFVGEGSCKKKKKSVGIDALACAISSVATIMEKSFDRRQSTPEEKAVAKAQAIYSALGNIPQLQRSEILKAMDILSHDTDRFGVFMTLPEDMKLEWLRMQF